MASDAAGVVRRARRATINDVARLAGVSKGAVSRALNDGAGVGPATLERVRAAAAELGWRPSASARALLGARALAIGLVVRRPANLLGDDPFFSDFVAGVETVLAVRGYSLVLSVVDETTEEASYRRLAAEGRVDGFILTDVYRREPRYGLLASLGLPVVALGVPGRRCPFPAVGSDERAVVRVAIEHLASLGRTRIGHVCGLRGHVHAETRRDAWRRSVRRVGLEPGPEACGEFTAAGGERATRALLDGREPPDAIFYANDLMAIAGMFVAVERGLRVPDDIAVVGFDDITLAAHVSPPLTTVTRGVRDWGAEAARLLLRVIDGASVPAWTQIHNELVVRGSTRPAEA